MYGMLGGYGSYELFSNAFETNRLPIVCGGLWVVARVYVLHGSFYVYCVMYMSGRHCLYCMVYCMC